MPQLQANIKLKAMSDAAENILHLVTANLSWAKTTNITILQLIKGDNSSIYIGLIMHHFFLNYYRYSQT